MSPIVVSCPHDMGLAMFSETKQGRTLRLSAFILSLRTHEPCAPVCLYSSLLSGFTVLLLARCKFHSLVDDVTLCIPYTEILVHIPNITGSECLYL